MWQALRDELHPQGFELVTVGMDTLGEKGCRSFMEAAKPTHPALIDQHHVLASAFGVVNIPSSIWIDEDGMIMRPAEAAPAPPTGASAPGLNAPTQLPPRFIAMFTEASKIPSDPTGYHDALKDWVAKGAGSRFALSPEEVIARSRPRDTNVALGHPKFKRTNPFPPGPKRSPSFNATLAFSRKNSYGLPSMPASRQSSQAR